MTQPQRGWFRFDHVGSLLRPRALKQAHREFAGGAIDALQLGKIVDACIVAAIRKQEAIGLPAINDGEFRRGSWFLGFVDAVDGLELRKTSLQFQSGSGEPAGWHGPAVTAKVRRTRGITTDDFAFVRANTGRAVKVTLPTPSALHFFGGKDGIDRLAYPDLDLFFSDLGAVYRAEIAALYGLGCRAIQLDEVPIALLCDPAIRSSVQASGMDPAALTDRYVRAINDAVRDRPADLAVGLHLCRGNYKGKWMGEGGYEPVAERLFRDADVDAFLLEFDSARAGGFAPLAQLPPGKRALLGLITTKQSMLESEDDLKRRIDEAARHVPLDQLGLCPQCGFASSAAGNPLSEDEQWRKLERVVSVARSVWRDSA